MSVLLREKTFPGGQRLEIAQGDLTLEPLDAIVNAANAHLQHGGGVAWAIVQRGGQVIQRESEAWVRAHGPVTHAKPAYTSGGALPCQYVIHAVGPQWGLSGAEERALAVTVRAALDCAAALGLQSIALPAISTGIFGFPKDLAAGIFFTEIQRYFDEQPTASLRLVRLTLFDTPTVEAFLQGYDHLEA